MIGSANASIFLVGAVSLAVSAFASPSPASGSAQGPDQIYCIVQDLTNNRVFHSSVFAGDYERSLDHKLAFRAHVTARWGPLGSGPGALCWFEASRAEASRAQDRLAAEHQSRRYNVIWTRWAG